MSRYMDGVLEPAVASILTSRKGVVTEKSIMRVLAVPWPMPDGHRRTRVHHENIREPDGSPAVPAPSNLQSGIPGSWRAVAGVTCDFGLSRPDIGFRVA